MHTFLSSFVLTSALISHGCRGDENLTSFDSKTQLQVLPADGLPDAEPVMAGLALDEKRVRMCQSVEEVRAREGKLLSIIIPAQPLKLRSEPVSVRPK